MEILNMVWRKQIIGLACALAILGCGSSTNNDQGTAFTFLGFFPEDTAPAGGGALPAGLAGLIVPISTAVNENDIDASNEAADGGGTTDGGGVIATVGLQNNIVGQFIRTERIFLRYYIQGSNVQPPDTSAVLSAIVGASTSSDPTVTSSLPSGLTGLGNQQFIEFFVLPPDIRAWLSLNRTRLPEPPFTMEVTAYITGISSAGNRYDTNEASIFIEITPETPVIPPDGTASEEGLSGNTQTRSDGVEEVLVPAGDSTSGSEQENSGDEPDKEESTDDSSSASGESL